MSHQEQTTESLIRKMAKEPPIRKNSWNWFVILGAVTLTSLYLLHLHPISSRFIHLPTLLPDFFGFLSSLFIRFGPYPNCVFRKNPLPKPHVFHYLSHFFGSFIRYVCSSGI